jgi:hypothetical protein
MIIQVGFNSPAFRQPKPPGGTTPAGSPVGLEMVDAVLKSIKPAPAGETENELLVQTLTAAVQSLAVTTWAFAPSAVARAKTKTKNFFMGIQD